MLDLLNISSSKERKILETFNKINHVSVFSVHINLGWLSRLILQLYSVSTGDTGNQNKTFIKSFWSARSVCILIYAFLYWNIYPPSALLCILYSCHGHSYLKSKYKIALDAVKLAKQIGRSDFYNITTKWLRLKILRKCISCFVMFLYLWSDEKVLHLHLRLISRRTWETSEVWALYEWIWMNERNPFSEVLNLNDFYLLRLQFSRPGLVQYSLGSE